MAIEKNPVMRNPEKGWEAVDKTARMLMQRAGYLNLPPDQFRYLICGEIDQKSVESDRYKIKHELEKKYKKLETVRRKQAESRCVEFQNEIERLDSIIEMQNSIIEDIDKENKENED
jgi:hypothetical protein